MMVIPNVGGISVFSPRLDPNGNSVRGAEVGKELVKYMSFHTIDVLFQNTKVGSVSPALATRRRLRRFSAPGQLLEHDLAPRKTSWDGADGTPLAGNGTPLASDGTPMAEMRRRARSAEDRARAAEERAQRAEERARRAEARAAEPLQRSGMLRRLGAAAATLVRRTSKEGVAMLRRERSKVLPMDAEEDEVPELKLPGIAGRTGGSVPDPQRPRKPTRRASVPTLIPVLELMSPAKPHVTCAGDLHTAEPCSLAPAGYSSCLWSVDGPGEQKIS